MITNETFAKLFNFIDKYGFEKQSDLLIEEMAELTKAITKYKRIAYDGQPLSKPMTITDAKEQIVEEIADVTILIREIVHLLNINPEEVESIMSEKINRTLSLEKNKNETRKSASNNTEIIFVYNDKDIIDMIENLLNEAGYSYINTRENIYNIINCLKNISVFYKFDFIIIPISLDNVGLIDFLGTFVRTVSVESSIKISFVSYEYSMLLKMKKSKLALTNFEIIVSSIRTDDTCIFNLNYRTLKDTFLLTNKNSILTSSKLISMGYKLNVFTRLI